MQCHAGLSRPTEVVKFGDYEKLTDKYVQFVNFLLHKKTVDEYCSIT